MYLVQKKDTGEMTYGVRLDNLLNYTSN